MDEAETRESTEDAGATGSDARPRQQSREARRLPRRLGREEKTIATMIGMYCRDHHAERAREPSAEGPSSSGDAPGWRAASSGLCEECSALLEYARARLERCPYGIDKPTCAKCTTHCYKPAMREQVRAVMRYAGPRMVKEHPLLAAAHLTDGRRKMPPR